jgi:hypothetical protein
MHKKIQIQIKKKGTDPYPTRPVPTLPGHNGTCSLEMELYI